MSARYTVVRGDPLRHKAEVLELLNRNLIERGEWASARYRKYYESNPVGPPVLLLAQDSSSQRFVGTCAVFPTRLRVSGEVLCGGIAGDFAVDAAHRGVGPAVALLRRALSEALEQGLDFVYGVGNVHSEAVGRRVGSVDLGRFTRFVKILRVGGLLERYTRPQSLARRAAGVSSFTVDPILSLTSRERRRDRSSRFCVERLGAFDDRFEAVWEAARCQHRVTSDRDAKLLNWKYEKDGAGHASATSPIFALFDGSGAAGYIVYATNGNVWEVFDIAFLPSAAVIDALLTEFVLEARREGAATIGLNYFGPSSLLTQRLRAFGFLVRKHREGVRVATRPDLRLKEDLLTPENWCLLPGGQDI